MSGGSLGNPDELASALMRAEVRVLKIQTKLHRWAREDPDFRFDDVFNLVADPAFLLVAWDRVRSNKGARTAGVDGRSAYYVQTVVGVERFLDELRTSLKDRSFRPLPVRERTGKARNVAKAPKALPCEARVIWRRPDCLNPMSPAVQTFTLPDTVSYVGATGIG